MNPTQPPDALLPQAFHAREALTVAHDLIGRWLRHGPVTLRITEVEAYRLGDTACHGHARGPTPATAALFGPPGLAYVYVCYGIHQLLNLSTGADGEAQAVLIRAAEPVAGAEVVRARRGGRSGPVTLTGPGKIGAALAVDTGFNHHPLFAAGGLELLQGEPAEAVVVGPRIGIGYADPVHVAAPWRVAAAGSRWVCRPRDLRPATADDRI